jgi:signal transduction histidine kinase
MVTIPENIQVSTAFGSGFPQISADPTMLKRILVNLMQNAVQAMPSGGKLVIRTKAEKGHVIIEIEDTDTGIPEDAREKIFAPLFTTKSKGQGFALL